jgi:PAS domain S-box-containing protein
MVTGVGSLVRTHLHPWIPVRLRAAGGEPSRGALGFRALPRGARVYVASVIAAGASLVAAFFPLDYPHPVAFALLLAASCLTSAWKVNLPLPLSSGSTLSMSYAAALLALILLGPHHAMIIAVAGTWTQCTVNVKQTYPPYRTIFSMAAGALTVQASGLAYTWLGGMSQPLPFAAMSRAIVGTIVTYFFMNTGLVAGAIALSTRRPLWRIWRDDFLWSGASFMVAGTAGAIAAVVIGRGDHWLAVLMLAPVYLTYRTYQVFLGRIEDERRHTAETQKLHTEAIEALIQAKRAEQALAQEKERLAVTLRSIGDGVITTDLDGTILLINNAAEALTGWTQQEAAGKKLAAVFQNFAPDTRKPCDNSAERLTRSASQPGVSRCSVLVARDLAERQIEEMTAPLRDASGRAIGMVVAFRDITEALKMQEERARASRIASLGLLAGGIAHDFNNILMAILGNVSMARGTVRPASPAALSLAEAEQACLRARQLTWQLLTFSRGGVPAKKTTSLARPLKESATLALRGTNVSCEFHIAPDLWTLSADETQLVQVFSNVLINAQQAMPHGGSIEIRAENIVEPCRRWEHALRVEPGPYLRVSITDRGIGIPEQNLGKIFDPYFSTKQKGSGLGLATSYSIIKNHGGYVSVASTLGVGTTVCVNLPASRSGDVEAPAGSVGRCAAGKGRILVMDDEASIRTVAVNMLKSLGHHAEVVSNGSAAVERYKRALQRGRPYDAVILDLMVPGGMGGKEAFERLTEIDPSVNVIMASGYTQDPVMTEFRDHGVKAVISKPFTLDELSRTLGSVMVKAEARTLGSVMVKAETRTLGSATVQAKPETLNSVTVQAKTETPNSVKVKAESWTVH